MNKFSTVIFLSLCTVIFFASCEGRKDREQKIKTDKAVASKNGIVDFTVLEFDSTDSWLFEAAKPTTLTSREVQELQTLLLECVEKYNHKQQKRFDTLSKTHPEHNLSFQNYTIELSRYKKQFYPVISKEGQKEVWVNCFCDDFDIDWRKEIIIVQDGGNCYFNMKINLTTKKCSPIYVNSEA